MKPFYKIFLSAILTLWTILRIFSEINHLPVRWDEQTNINVVKETSERKSFPILYYKNQPFFQKSPLWYWLNLPFAAGKQTEITSFRTVSISSAVLIVSIIIIFLWRNFGFISGMIAWLILLSSHQMFEKNPGGFFSSHTLITADLDSLQILFILISFILLLSKQKTNSIIAGIVIGLAILTKGPGGFIPLLALLVLRRGIKTPLLSAILTAVPWYVFMFFNFGQEFVQTHFGHHLIARTVTSLDGHHNPPRYYLQILTHSRVYPLFPLVLLAVVLLAKIRPIPFAVRFCGLTAALFFIIPSLIETRLAWYILPIYPFLAMFSGMVLGKLTAKKFAKII